MTKERWNYYKKNWKLGVHLILKTRRFGVNNQWWSSFDAYFSCPWYKILWGIPTIRPLLDNYKMMKLRAGTMAHFLTDEAYELAFGESKYEHKKI